MKISIFLHKVIFYVCMLYELKSISFLSSIGCNEGLDMCGFAYGVQKAHPTASPYSQKPPQLHRMGFEDIPQ